jgi:hypothetical protein
VTINGITQNPPVNYSTNGSTLTFTDPPALNSVIRVLQQAVIGTSIVPVDGSVGTSKLASGLTLSGSTTLSGNLTFSGTGTRILGDFSNATLTNRTAFQSSTTNGATRVLAIPNGSSTVSTYAVFNNSDPTNTGFGQIAATSSDIQITSSITGTGTYLPLTMLTGGSERLRIDTSGNIGIGTNSPASSGGYTALTLNNATNSGYVVLQTNGTTTSDWYVSGGTVATIRGVGVPLTFSSTGANYIAASTNGTERMRIDSSGNILIGSSTARTAGSGSGINLQLEGAPSPSNFGLIRNSNNAFPARIMFAKTRGTVVGSNAVVQNGDQLGLIEFDGADGTGLILGASIEAYVDGTPGTNDMPGRLVFNTTADGAASATERMRIDSSGNVGIGTSSPAAGVKLDVLGGEIRAGRVDTGSEGGQVSFSRSSDNATAWYLDVFGNTSTPSFRVVDVGAGAVSMAINSSGAVALRGAVSASGVGITFPATQSASSDANTLDDYEEGTFTPTLYGTVTAGTLSVGVNYGEYTKIGNTVNFWIRIENQTLTGAAGPMAIGNLPFSRGGLSSMDPPYSPGLHNIAFSTTGRSWFYLRGTTLEGLQAVSGSAWVNWNVTNSSGIYITISGSYRIA